ncbi:hypothetical protein B9479_008142 [Cryptococcus floricola]|uniref:Uncharacterized protein n=1 Tax=Cryptococcus floricola TaxID=2591691 RepID=A0A5D3AML7_9TREE|nr:hypothetical protein B9479_008142 [Cryptococcus floricola]
MSGTALGGTPVLRQSLPRSPGSHPERGIHLRSWAVPTSRLTLHAYTSRTGRWRPSSFPTPKTDPTHQGVLIALPRGVDPAVCPVRALRGLRAMYPAPPTVPLFSLAGGAPFLPSPSRDRLIPQPRAPPSWFHAAVHWAGRRGRWKGDSLLRYIQHSPAENQTLVSSTYHSNPSPLAPLPGVVPPAAVFEPHA